MTGVSGMRPWDDPPSRPPSVVTSPDGRDGAGVLPVTRRHYRPDAPGTRMDGLASLVQEAAHGTSQPSPGAAAGEDGPVVATPVPDAQPDRLRARAVRRRGAPGGPAGTDLAAGGRPRARRRRRTGRL